MRGDQRPIRLAQIEPTILCNLQCIMCPWKEERAKGGFLSWETFERNTPHLEEIAEVDLSGGGEPLLHPRIIDMAALARAKGCRVGLLTNATLLTPQLSQALLDAGIDWMAFSMDAASKGLYEHIRRGARFDVVRENISALAASRREGRPYIMINFVLMRVNHHELEGVIRLAADLGVDQVNVKQCDVIRGEHGRALGVFSRKETQEVRRIGRQVKSAVKLAKRFGIKVHLFSMIPTELPVCAQDPRSSLFVRWDGKVAPCINLAYGGPSTFFGEPVFIPTVLWGDLNREDLSAIWDSPGCRAFRKAFEEREVVYRERVYSVLMDTSWPNPIRALREATEAMPPPPNGCSTCHYLYNV